MSEIARRWRGWRTRLPFDKVDQTLVLGLIGVAILIGAFLLLADEVMEGGTHGFDTAILMAFRSAAQPQSPIGPLWLQEMGRDITALGSFPILGLIIAAVTVYTILARHRRTALLILGAVLGGVVISQLLKLGYDRPRPDLGGATHVFTASFPSGHSMLSAVTYLTLGALLTRTVASKGIKIFFIGCAIVLTLLVGISRVYLGVHFPTDVLAGWCLGAAWAALCLVAAIWLQRRAKISSETGSD